MMVIVDAEEARGWYLTSKKILKNDHDKEIEKKLDHRFKASSS
jgi:hypothetical protein